MDSSYFSSILLVKDFEGKGFRINNEMTTNAAPPLAFAAKGLLSNNTNPFTGKGIRMFKDEKGSPELIYINNKAKEQSTGKNNGEKYLSAKWFTVKDSIYNSDNWEYLGYH